MIQKGIKFLSVLLLTAVTDLSYGQFFQGLYDCDSTYDWGWDIVQQPDNNYFVRGTFEDQNTGLWSLCNMQISADGSTVLSKHILQFNGLTLILGNPGEMKQLASGYVAPISITLSSGAYVRGWAGLIKYDAAGDTVALKTYTDTSKYFDGFVSCSIMPDSGYVLGGIHDYNVPIAYYPGYIIRTDKSGDTLWTHTYQKFSTENSVIDNVIPLPDGRIVAAGYSTYMEGAGGVHNILYYHHTPWFMVLDSKGNILRDTLFGNQYVVGSNICGELYKDMNGGYIHIGTYDSLVTEYPDDLQNFPAYVAHLDTDFRITWIRELNYSDHYGHRQGVVVKQLADSSYIVTGDNDTYNHPPDAMGFAAKINRDGKLLWSHTYYSDTKWGGYLRDVAEKPDGSLVFTGASMNDTMPTWHARRDVWLLGVDSNGCQMAGGCDPDTSNGVVDTTTGIPLTPKGGIPILSIYPNPTTGVFTIDAPGNGTFTLYTMLGQQLQQYIVIKGQTNFQLPVNLAAGMYMGEYKPDDGSATREIRLVYQR